MNTNPLARLYDRVSVWERIPLLLAAEARGDAAEYQRLFQASPQKTWQFSEHLLAEQALHVMALIYIGEQLNVAGTYFFSLWKLECDPQDADWLLTAQGCGYVFVTNAEAWRRFCQELKVDPVALTAANHHGWFLPFCEERMPANAPTAEALLALYRDAGLEAPHLVTADEILASWQRLLQSMNSYALR